MLRYAHLNIYSIFIAVFKNCNELKKINTSYTITRWLCALIVDEKCLLHIRRCEINMQLRETEHYWRATNPNSCHNLTSKCNYVPHNSDSSMRDPISTVVWPDQLKHSITVFVIFLLLRRDTIAKSTYKRRYLIGSLQFQRVTVHYHHGRK